MIFLQREVCFGTEYGGPHIIGWKLHFITATLCYNTDPACFVRVCDSWRSLKYNLAHARFRTNRWSSSTFSSRHREEWETLQLSDFLWRFYTLSSSKINSPFFMSLYQSKIKLQTHLSWHNHLPVILKPTVSLDFLIMWTRPKNWFKLDVSWWIENAAARVLKNKRNLEDGA